MIVWFNLWYCRVTQFPQGLGNIEFCDWFIHYLQIYQVHHSLQGGSNCIVLSGVSGSGKTTSYRCLAGAYHHIRELRALGKQSSNNGKKGPTTVHRATGSNSAVASSNDYPCVDITVINPAVYSLKEVMVQIAQYYCLSPYLQFSRFFSVFTLHASMHKGIKIIDFIYLLLSIVSVYSDWWGVYRVIR